jgi:hypothetical protein
MAKEVWHIISFWFVIQHIAMAKKRMAALRAAILQK